MSPAVVSQIPFTPHLPPSRRQLLNRSFMGSVIKTTTYYNVDAKTGLAPWAKHNVNGRVSLEMRSWSVVTPGLVR